MHNDLSARFLSSQIHENCRNCQLCIAVELSSTNLHYFRLQILMLIVAVLLSEQIGNCVGSANHWYFIMFLISVIISCTYVFMMTLYAGFHVWPPLALRNLNLSSSGPGIAASILKEIVAALASSALLLSARGLILIYLAFASVSVEIGIIALLWQQLHWIYEGNTYISQITSHNGARRQGGCQNLFRFFGCPHLVFRVFLGSGNSGKLQDISSSKLL